MFDPETTGIQQTQPPAKRAGGVFLKQEPREEKRRGKLPQRLERKPYLRWLIPLLLALFLLEFLTLTCHTLTRERAVVVQLAAVLFALPFALCLLGKLRTVPGWLFVSMMLPLCELQLQIWTFAEFSYLRLLVILLLDGGVGLLLSLLTAIGHSDRVSRIVAAVLSVLFVALYFAEYVMWDAYDGAFMGFSIMLSTGTAAIKGFDTYIRGAILGELWRLALMLVPIVCYLWLGRALGWGGERRWRVRGLIALCGAVCIGLGFLATLLLPMREKYSDTPFHKDVNSFGLLTAFVLEPVKKVRTVDDFLPEAEPTESAVALPSAEPPETAQTETPAQTESAETTDAPTETPTEPAGERKPYNVMDLDFTQLAAEEEDPELAKLHEYVASRKPSSTNEYTGLFEGKNLIFITAEAFSKEVIDPELTPALYRLATQGIQFSDYYQPAWGGSTSTGEYSNLIGLVPVGANDIQLTAECNMYFTIGNRLNALGYHSYGYHNNSYTYYNRHKTHPNLGYPTWIGMGNGMEEGVDDTWPESDRQMIDFTMDQYMDEQPFSVYYITVSGHGVYSRMGNLMSARHYDDVADLYCSETVKCYLAANLELEYAMEDLLERLEAEGLLDDTVIVIAPDHYPYCLTESSTWGNTEDYLAELYGYEADDCFRQDHNALIIWSGCLEGEDVVVDTPSYSLDILPTLLNLFGIEFDSRLLVGRDVFSDAEPLVLWNDHSWKTDKGSFNAQTNRFTPAPDADIEEDYADQIDNAVSNRINFSRAVLKRNYYALLFGEDAS